MSLFPPNWATLNTRARWRWVRRLQRLSRRERLAWAARKEVAIPAAPSPYDRIPPARSRHSGSGVDPARSAACKRAWATIRANRAAREALA